MFERPDIYTSASDRGDFSHFDREYERQHMPQLVQAGWPVNWEYVDMKNVGPVAKALVHRSLVHGTGQGIEQVSTGFTELISGAKKQIDAIMSLLQRKKVGEDIPEEISGTDKKSMAHV